MEGCRARGFKNLHLMLPYFKRSRNNIGMVQLLGMAVKRGCIYSNRQKTKQAMSDAQLCTLKKWRQVRKLPRQTFEARQSTIRTNLFYYPLAVLVLAWAVLSDDPSYGQSKTFLRIFLTASSWFTNLWILVVWYMM